MGTPPTSSLRLQVTLLCLSRVHRISLYCCSNGLETKPVHLLYPVRIVISCLHTSWAILSKDISVCQSSAKLLCKACKVATAENECTFSYLWQALYPAAGASNRVCACHFSRPTAVANHSFDSCQEDLDCTETQHEAWSQSQCETKP